MSMPSEVPVPSANNEPLRGLPPVAPPSGRFIVQLFLVPGLIVAVAVLILLGFKFLVGGTRTAEAYLKDLDNANPDVRWRAASDLAQTLQRPESLALASDPKFGLDLADRLQAALDDIKKDEEATAKRTQKLAELERQAAWRALEPKRNYVLFLSASLGSMTVPVGAPLLGEIATNDRGGDPKGIALRRRRAVWALANLGDNLGRFQQLSATEKDAAIARLEQEAAGKGKRAEWAAAALAYLKDKKPLGVDRALAECAQDSDPFLRELVAFALKYWDGDEIEPTLVKLSRDTGEGTTIEVGEGD
jgi:hypothetical protein